MGVDISPTTRQLERTGTVGNPFPDTEYFTNINVSGDLDASLGGDVTGSALSNTVEKIQGRSVLDAAPSDGDVLTWDAANSRWAPTAQSGIPKPGTKATNDLLQYTGAAWDAKGAASGDRLGGTLYGSAVDLAGHLTFTADNAYDIGASGATRPRTGYFGTSVVIAGQTAMKGGDSTGGDLSGTYPTTLTVAKVQGYSMTSGAPAKGDLWEYDGTNWTHVRNRDRHLARATATLTTGTTDVVSYAAAAGEFSANSTILAVVEFYNPNGLNVTPFIRATLGANNYDIASTAASFAYNNNLVKMWTWERLDSNAQSQYYSEQYGGTAAGTVATEANLWTSATTWKIRITVGVGGGNVYVRGYLIEIRKE